jgi:hypothetical protein
MLYGMEVVYLKKGDMSTLETAHRELLRMFQSLPPRSANAATYLLVGAMPIEAEIDMRRLGLLGGIIRSSDMNLRELALRQTAMKDPDSKSWFVRTTVLLIKYGLPSICDLLKDPPEKQSWKLLVKRAVKGHWCGILKTEARSKTTLKFLNIDGLRPGRAHPCWSTVTQSLKDVRRAITKARLITGTYMTQSVRCLHSQGKIPPTCLLCCSGEEDLHHMLLECPALHDTRAKYIPSIRDIVTSQSGNNKWLDLCSQGDLLLQLVLDSSMLYDPFKGSIATAELEDVSRRMCHSIHCQGRDDDQATMWGGGHL